MRNRVLGVVSILLLWGSCSASAELRAGAARVDITPKTHEPMWGFEDRTDPATGTLDPLYAAHPGIGGCGEANCPCRTRSRPYLRGTLTRPFERSGQQVERHLVPASDCLPYTWRSGHQRRVRQSFPRMGAKGTGWDRCSNQERCRSSPECSNRQWNRVSLHRPQSTPCK